MYMMYHKKSQRIPVSRLRVRMAPWAALGLSAGTCVTAPTATAEQAVRQVGLIIFHALFRNIRLFENTYNFIVHLPQS